MSTSTVKYQITPMGLNTSLLRNVSIFAATATLSLLAAPAYAGITLNGTSGEWSNPNGGTAIQYRTDENGTEKIRWGDPAWGFSYTAGKSGLGFRGVGNLDLTVGEVFNLGRLSHYNKTIWSGTAADSADLKVDLDFGFGKQSFDFTMNIDETPNYAGHNPGGVCPYITTTYNGCSDSITWSNTISANTFNIGNNEYKLDLVGFSDSLDVSTIQTQFISQEGMDSHAHIFAQIVAVNPLPQEVPEPMALAGLGLVGFAAARSRRSKSAEA